MNKKGTVFEEILWIPNIIFLIFVVIALFLIINSFTDVNINTSKIEPEIFANRLIYSSNAFNFCDNIRCYPGVIDYSIISNQALLQSRLNDSFHSSLDSRLVAFKATLFDSDNSRLTDVYFNKEWYDRWVPLVFSGKFSEVERGYYVLYNKDGNLSRGVLKLDLVVEVE